MAITNFRNLFGRQEIHQRGETFRRLLPLTAHALDNEKEAWMCIRRCLSNQWTASSYWACVNTLAVRRTSEIVG